MQIQPNTPPVTTTKSPKKTTGHYENFPVASWLCPKHLRPAVLAIYHFARTADDIADEGTATAAERLAQLQQYHMDLLLHCHHDQNKHPNDIASTSTWAHIFNPLAETVHHFELPLHLLEALLQAFEQDVIHTQNQHVYTNNAELLAYCTKSANPIGRLLLHLHASTSTSTSTSKNNTTKITNTQLQQSDAICSALQLINFWQDLKQDLPRKRFYLPQDVCQRHGISPHQPEKTPFATQAAIKEQCEYAQSLMEQGRQLVFGISGRMGWELRWVVQGGLRILHKIQSTNHNVLQHRHKLNVWDFCRIAWEVLWMKP